MPFFRRRTGLILTLFFALTGAVASKYWNLDVELPPLPAPPSPPDVPIVANNEVVEDTIHKNRTLVATLVDYEVPVAIANEVADLIKPIFDLRKLRFGNPFRLEKESDGTLTKFEYKIDDESVLKVHKGGDAYEAKVEKLDL